MDFNPKTDALPHQIEAVEFVAGKPSVAIFDEQGLGKTKIVLDILLRGFATGEVDRALVVCKNSLLRTWQAEIEKHTHLRGVILSGDRTTTSRGLMVFSRFYLVAYSIVHRELSRLRQLMALGKCAIILDESHTIKNPKSRVTADVLSLRGLATKRLILTGTPVANYPEDLWTQFYFLDDGRALGTEFDAFRLFYDLGQGADRRAVSSENLQAISAAIRPLSIRRTKAGTLELPEKTFESREVPLHGAQAAMYSRVQSELRLQLVHDGKLVGTITVENALERLLRLVQICSNPALIDPGFDQPPAKFVILDQMLQEIMGSGEKAVVWSQFVQNVEQLGRRYREFGAAVIHGGVTLEDRHRVVTRFQAEPSRRLIFAVPGAAREGLTLTAANHAIYIDRSFNLVDYLQSQDRIHRIGQDKPCVITKLVARETIDGFVDEVLTRKAEIAEAIGGGVGRQKGEAVTGEEIARALGSDDLAR
jgi:SNF2 family DNA or RNA helicase